MVAYIGLLLVTWVGAALSSISDSLGRLYAQSSRSAVPSRTPGGRTPLQPTSKFNSKPVSSRLNIFDLVLCLVLILFSALRYGVGTDYFLYVRLYNLIEAQSLRASIEESPQEPGFTFVMFLLRQISAPPDSVFLVASIITVVPTLLTLKRCSSNYTLAVFLYVALGFYLTPLNVVRQGIAVALNFYAAKYVNSDPKKFLLLNGIAATFHLSVIFVAMLQLISRRWKPSFKLLIFVSMFTVVGVAILSTGVVASALTLINPRYAVYANSTDLGGGAGTLFVLTVHILLVIFSLSLPTKLEIENAQVFSMLAIPFLVAGFISSPVSRIEEYFSIFVLLALPNQLQILKGKTGFQVLLIGLGAAYFVAFLYSFGGLLPYQVGP